MESAEEKQKRKKKILTAQTDPSIFSVNLTHHTLHTYCTPLHISTHSAHAQSTQNTNTALT